ncbi:prolyl oligopeptidase family serine peptidase [Streptomyces sp. TLI_171]|uniref:S9 family peptidase n=1 Tax=Streptomyces sp. TLI_171 TaxID=1938859 RepID=UPI000C1753EA|nr:prolyl oligopeptidase family serine peptidase [Streptomyces sp. TLI_171]RKE17448.1 prolyl oligopeptidase family protein [Streptomyces sp. TLI_171]
MSTATLAPAATVHHRLSAAFTTDGTRLACLAAHTDGRCTAELWNLTGPAPQRTELRAAHEAETPRTQVLPLPDGRLLLCRSTPGRHDLRTATPGDHRTRPLGTLYHPAVRLLPWPGPEGLAALVTTDSRRRSTLRLLAGPGPDLQTLAELPGGLLGGDWLDPHRLLALHYTDGTAHGIVVETRTGRAEPLPGAEPGERPLLAAPRTGQLLVAVPTATGSHRLGLRPLDGHTPTRHPEGLNSLPGGIRPLAFDPTGTRLAVRSDRGAAARILVHRLDTDTATELPAPPGTFGDRAHWTRTGLHLLHSSPERPTAPLRLPAAPEAAPVAGVRQLAGADGPLEAVVYGDPGTAEHAVLALHGGPETAWRLEYDPLLAEFAAAGLAVLALNQRGSTGYGPAHRDAIRQDWGGPDLADVLTVGHRLARERAARGLEPPALYGISYGAWLALLAGTDPHAPWSRCAAVAPFRSVPHLAATGAPGVRAMLHRLGAPAEPAAERDLHRRADRIRVPLLLLHGEQDEVVPVAHSRELHAHLRDLGRDVHYREIPGAGHHPVTGPSGPAVRAALTDFLRTGAH